MSPGTTAAQCRMVARDAAADAYRAKWSIVGRTSGVRVALSIRHSVAVIRRVRTHLRERFCCTDEWWTTRMNHPL